MQEVLEPEAEAPDLLFVDLGDDPDPIPGKPYPVVPASSSAVAHRPLPESNRYELSIDLLRFNAGDLPDLSHNNEASFTLQVDAQNPQDPVDKKAAALVTKFDVRDYRQGAGFLYRGAFTHVTLTNDVNMRVTLDEIDGQFAAGFAKVLGVLDDSGLMEIDAVKAFPYLDVVESLVSGLVETFRGTNDDVWSERIHLWTKPTAGAGRAYLRTGTYAITGAQQDLFELAQSRQVTYRNGALEVGGTPLQATYLLLSIAIDPVD